MKNLFYILFALVAVNGTAQDIQKSGANRQGITTGDKYSNTLNAGTGIVYSPYVGYAVPVFLADFELNIDRNLTLAPFIGLYNYKQDYYWGDVDHAPQYYTYTETVIPVGAKATFYFDQLLDAGSRWDFYAAGSMGYIYRKTKWQTGYDGDKQIYPGTGLLYLNAHIGTEFHFCKMMGLQFDLSANNTTLGLAFHF